MRTMIINQWTNARARSQYIVLNLSTLHKMQMPGNIGEHRAHREPGQGENDPRESDWPPRIKKDLHFERQVESEMDFCPRCHVLGNCADTFLGASKRESRQ